jgi:hypothetical protein
MNYSDPQYTGLTAAADLAPDGMVRERLRAQPGEERQPWLT